MTAPSGRVLVVRYGRIGDMLVVTPALRAIRRALPQARIEVLTSADGHAVLAANPNADAVHVLEWRRVPAWINPPRARIVARLRAARYDDVFLLEGAAHHHALVNGIGAGRIYTFAKTHETADALHARRSPHHELYNFFAVLALAGIEPAGEHYDFDAGDEARANAGELLQRSGVASGAAVAGIHAGHYRRRRITRRPHPKTWPLDRWIDTAMGLFERGHDRIVLTGSAAERRLNRRITAALPSGSTVDLAGRTDLPTLAAVIERCRVFVAPDTGPAHLAAAVDTPLIALFGPKPPHIMGPRGDETRIIRLFPESSIAPEAERRGHHPRMWSIQPADVLAAVDRLVPPLTGHPVA